MSEVNRYLDDKGGYEMSMVATSASKARYSKWLDISDVDADLTFARFRREAKVRAA